MAPPIKRSSIKVKELLMRYSAESSIFIMQRKSHKIIFSAPQKIHTRATRRYIKSSP